MAVGIVLIINVRREHTGIFDSQNTFLAGFGGPACPVHHPEEVRFDPRHAVEGVCRAAESPVFRRIRRNGRVKSLIHQQDVVAQLSQNGYVFEFDPAE